MLEIVRGVLKNKSARSTSDMQGSGELTLLHIVAHTVYLCSST